MFEDRLRSRKLSSWPQIARSYRQHLTLFVVMVALAFALGGRVGVAQAQTGGRITCAATPTTIGGQGFNVAGLGFNVAGLGFNVAGLGFNVAGLGFNVAGLGFNVAGLSIDPLTLAAEIRDNTITTDWLRDLLPFIKDGQGYNTVKTAVLVIDDREHGAQVLAVFDALKNTPGFNMSNIRIEFVDITNDNGDGDGEGYSTDDIDDEIREAVDRLWAEGYRHFVLNMSFGLVPCDDPNIGVNGVTYPWNFFDALDAIEVAEANGGKAPQKPISPVLECVEEQGQGNLIARFGYLNPNSYPVSIPWGNDNKLTGHVKDGELPTLFEPGRQQNVFKIRFQPQQGPLVWTLNGRTSTASKDSKRCGGALPTPTARISPVLECVTDNGNGSYTALFGYESDNSVSVYLPAANQNNGQPHLKSYFNPAPEDRGQPRYYLPGRRVGVFRVNFNGSNLVWTIKGPDGQTRTATASSGSKACAADTGYGVDDYLRDTVGVPPQLIDEYLKEVFNRGNQTGNGSDPNLDPLRALLAQYLARSRSNTDGFGAFPVASSGNFRPLIGDDQPLAPARWPEVIAVGATVGNTGNWWTFSQLGNVLSPGVAFPLGNNTRVAGTSFAAPFTSMYLAQWATYPNACTFPLVNGVVRPPLTAPDTLGNAQVTSASPNAYINAFTCVKPVPQNTVCYATDVVNYAPTKRKDGKNLDSRRTNPNKALGAPQNNDTENFVSLGFGGTLTLGFDSAILNANGTAPDLRVWETTFNDRNRPWSRYPEKALIYASVDNETWVLIGETSDKDQAYDLGSLSSASYIKFVDTSDRTKFGGGDDGFDVDAVEGFTCAPGLDNGASARDGKGKGKGKNKRGQDAAASDLRGVDPLNNGGAAPVTVDPTPVPSSDGFIPLPPPPPSN